MSKVESVESLVSVVISTRKRPRLVTRAVRSALTQTLHAIEVIVVIDGPDDATRRVLQQIDDPRLRVRMLSVHSGHAHAVNAGVGEAQGQWIAFLDDDDEWFPKKLELQLRTARLSHCLYPIIACRLIGRSEVGDFVWPRRFKKPKEFLSEYLLCRNRLFWGEGLIQTSTIFTARQLLKKVPFRSDLCKHFDEDWLLRASTVDGVAVKFVPTSEPLVIWHIESNRSRISNSPDWRYSLSWIQGNRQLVTPRAYASFLLSRVSSSAARQGDWKAFFVLIREAYRHGKPTTMDALSYVGNWLIPRRVQRLIAAFFARSCLGSENLEITTPRHESTSG